MFTFTKLGTMGRFGNQLFQIAATIGIARRNDRAYIFPKWDHAGYFARRLPQASQTLQPEFSITQIAFDYRDFRVSALDRPDTLIDLVGYFQTEKFFAHCADEIRAYFAPRDEWLASIDETYGPPLRNEQTCVVVVRRGDYAQYPMHFPMQPPVYYERAMAAFDTETLFLVASDDVEWCQQHIRAKHLLFLPLDRPDSWIRNFFIGTLCQNAIIANTTYGWWIAWLNQHPGKRVLAPKPWFGPALDYLDTSDVVPAAWEACHVTADASRPLVTAHD